MIQQASYFKPVAHLFVIDLISSCYVTLMIFMSKIQSNLQNELKSIRCRLVLESFKGIKAWQPCFVVQNLILNQELLLLLLANTGGMIHHSDHTKSTFLNRCLAYPKQYYQSASFSLQIYLAIGFLSVMMCISRVRFCC